MIVVPEEGSGVRAIKAVCLMKDRYTDRIIISLRVVTVSSDTADACKESVVSEEELIKRMI